MHYQGVQFQKKTDNFIATAPDCTGNIHGKNFKVDTSKKVARLKKGDVFYGLTKDDEALGASLGFAFKEFNCNNSLRTYSSRYIGNYKILDKFGETYTSYKHLCYNTVTE